jgi:Predicted transcriptional regulators
MEVDPQVIGSRIKIKRVEAGLSQKELAQAIGVSPPAINRFEKGIKSPSIETLAKLASSLGVSSDYLLGAIADGDVFVDEAVMDAFKSFKALSYKDRQQIIQNIHFLKSR